jgi:hypothetical protein
MKENKSERTPCITKFVILCVIVSSFYACSPYPSGVEQALRYAGENRMELEKVLDHYRQDEADSLKYQAACFLIENMVLHYSYDMPEMESYKKDLYQLIAKDLLSESETKKLLDEKYRNPMPRNKLSDVQNITADYLIRNIDHAFMVWEKQPWGKSISFNIFCEEILPYRISNEPLQDWRIAYYNYFQPILDSKLKDGNMVSAMKILYDTLSTQPLYFLYTTPLPQRQGGIDLLNNRVGACEDFADMGVYIMRALGIPGSTDIIIQNPDHQYRFHFWNSFTAGNERYEWEVNEVAPMKGGVNPIRKRGKIYRRRFNIESNGFYVRHSKEELPALLKNPLLKDVSSEYYSGYKLTVTIDKKDVKDKLLYLYVFDNNDWIPMAACEIRKGNIH